jgi:hypothetical protein
MLDAEEERGLIHYCAAQLIELCRLCEAPGEVCWTGLVFFQRFFAARSPMEFDPTPMLYACVHLACKVEEVHEITLDHILRSERHLCAAECEDLRSRVLGLELPLLEALSFQLLVEPKPQPSLRILIEEMRLEYGEGGEPWDVLLEVAESLTLELAANTDAVLRWPPSAIFAGALRAALRDGSRVLLEPGAACSMTTRLEDVLFAHVESKHLRDTVHCLIEGVISTIATLHAEELSGLTQETEAAFRERKQRAAPWHRIFEFARREGAVRHEAHRLERKRRWKVLGNERKPVPTPLTSRHFDVKRRLILGECRNIVMGSRIDEVDDEDQDEDLQSP